MVITKIEHPSCIETMERTIEFTGKSIKDGQWVYGYHYRDGDIWYIQTFLESVEIDPFTLREFTKKRDIHNQKIFEDDIVRFKVDGTLALVIWKDYGWCTQCNKKDFIFGSDICKISNGISYEVIGNIIDNPDLWLMENKDE